MTRVIVLVILFFCLIYDAMCMVMGWPTISSVVEKLDLECGMLIRWCMIALWFHWFLFNWKGATGG